MEHILSGIMRVRVCGCVDAVVSSSLKFHKLVPLPPHCKNSHDICVEIIVICKSGISLLE